MATPERFDEVLDDFEGDEATVLIIDLDEFSLVAEEYGDEVSNRVLRIIADRLVEQCGPHDHLARLDHDRFAILFTEADRSTVLGTAKALLHVMAEPLAIDGGPAAVSATMALAHQIGLVDLEDMLDSANAAIRSGKRNGAGKLVLAA